MNINRTLCSYQVGGSLAADSPCYVEREADRELETALKQGEFCYVLNSRQMGKSSLRVRTMAKLQAEGTVCIFIDLTGMGTQDVTAEKWYAGIILAIVDRCNLEFDWRTWWREYRDLLTPVQRLAWFIESVLLVEVSSKIVIFIDEIDRVLSQNFSLDDFLVFIYSCYQKRQINSAFKCLTFTLLGVASPQNLIRDKNNSTFELGRKICLSGFSLGEATSLIEGWSIISDRPEAILAEILDWTNGQPFLTQKLCQLTLEKFKKLSLAKPREQIADIVERYIIYDWETQDEPEHLKTIRDRLCYRDSAITIRLLGLYQDILQQRSVAIDNSIEQIELRLSGLAIVEAGKLKVNNPIYSSIFNLAWIEIELRKLRPYSQTFTNWLATKDSSYLLTGKKLQSALTWSLGKSLTNCDYQFLVASQELAKQELADNLAATKAASELLAESIKKASFKAKKSFLGKYCLSKIVLIITAIILTLRFTGILQAWEWNLLDRFFIWRLTDTIEPRVVVVTISEQDLQAVGRIPIPNKILAEAINNLKVKQPKAIALDLYRDLPVELPDISLQQIIRSTPNLYLVEKVIGELISPPNVDSERLGFSDVIIDSDDKVRRALLSIADKNGQVKFSLGAKIALQYLQDKQLQFQYLTDYRYRLGEANFKRLTANSGGYINADVGGYQILLNYWGTENNFTRYSLTEVLNNQIAESEIRDRLIFIGSTAESVRDAFATPYSKGWFRSPRRMPGVFIHANVASQIINSAMGERPLIINLSIGCELLCILTWVIIAVAITRKLRSLFIITIYIFLITAILIAICYVTFIVGYWLPLVPT
ncbi:MAG: CHASE2 domain-containing protein, partial [Pleurocapsa sp.]